MFVVLDMHEVRSSTLLVSTSRQCLHPISVEVRHDANFYHTMGSLNFFQFSVENPGNPYGVRFSGFFLFWRENPPHPVSDGGGRGISELNARKA